MVDYLHVDGVVPVHPVLGDLGSEPGAEPVVGVRGCVAVRFELSKLTEISIYLLPTIELLLETFWQKHSDYNSY